MADIQNLDENTKKAIDERVKAATYLAPDFNEAVKQGQIKTFQPTSFNYGPMAQSAALQRRADKIFKDKVQEIQSLQKLSYPNEAFQKSKQAESLLLQKQKFDYARMQALKLRKQQEEAQRSQLLGSILGLAGAAAGAYFGGGPMGAAAGAKAGSSIGSSI